MTSKQTYLNSLLMQQKWTKWTTNQREALTDLESYNPWLAALQVSSPVAPVPRLGRFNCLAWFDGRLYWIAGLVACIVINISMTLVPGLAGVE